MRLLEITYLAGFFSKPKLENSVKSRNIWLVSFQTLLIFTSLFHLS